MYAFCGAAVLILLRFFGLAGLFLFIAIAIVSSNIQVLKAVQFCFLSEPVALGTITFSATYLCSDIITEYYGKDAARLAVWLSFAGMLLFDGLILLTLGFKTGSDQFLDAHHAMLTLYAPSIAIFVASLVSYLVSQYSDIWIYNLMHMKSGNKNIWVRSIFATSLSGLIDNTIFSVLAWQVFSPTPLDFHTLLYTYILGTLGIRVLMSVLNTPFIYAAKYLLPKKLSYEFIR